MFCRYFIFSVTVIVYPDDLYTRQAIFILIIIKSIFILWSTQACFDARRIMDIIRV